MARGTPLQNMGQDALCLHNEEGTMVGLNGHQGGGPSKENIRYVGLYLYHNIFNPYWLVDWYKLIEL